MRMVDFESLDWSPVMAMDRDVKLEITERIFRRFRAMVARYEGSSPSILRKEAAENAMRQMGHRRGEPISFLMEQAMVCCWLHEMPERMRLLTIGKFVEEMTNREIRGYLETKGYRYAKRSYVRWIYGPEEGKTLERPAVVDYWAAFEARKGLTRGTLLG